MKENRPTKSPRENNERESTVVNDSDTGNDSTGGAVEAAQPIRTRKEKATQAQTQFPDIPGYEILSKLGQGGMGVVYEARHVSLDRRVALKLLPGGMASDEIAIQRFLREARSAGALHHTNIVPVFDVGCTNNAHYYAMQLIEGAPLNDVIRDVDSARQGNLPDDKTCKSAAVARMLVSTAIAPKSQVELETDSDRFAETVIGEIDSESVHARSDTSKSLVATTSVSQPPRNVSEANIRQLSPKRYCQLVAKLGLQVAEALQHAHSYGILHRDIKPANLMLDHSGNVWVTDFGLAKTTDSDLSVTGTIVGTLRFMSPERFRGEGDERSDIYALGATLYELLVLRPAFEAVDEVSLMENIQAGSASPLRSIDQHVPKDLETIVHKCLEKTPSRRYQTSEQLADDLRRHVNGEPILARRVGVAERLWLWAKKNRTVAALLSLIAVGLISATIASSIALVAIQNLAQDAKTEAETATAINDFFNRDILGAGNPMEGNVDRNTTLLTVLDAAAEKVHERFPDKPIVEGQIHLTIGEAYVALAEYEQATDHLKKAQTLLEKHLDSNHETLTEVELQLGRMYRNSLHDFRRGYRMLNAVQQKQVRELGFDHPKALEASFELAIALLDSDRRQQGVDLMKKVYDSRRSALGEMHRRTLQALICVSEIEVDDRPESALPLAKQAVDLTQRQLGNRDILTIMARANLADLYLDRRDVESALKILGEAVSTCEEWLGKNHPRTIRVLLAQTKAYDMSGNIDATIEGLRQNAIRTEATHGRDTLVTQYALQDLAGQLIEKNRDVKEARKLLTEVRAFFASMYGEGEETVALTDFKIAQADTILKPRGDESRRMKDAWETVRKSLGDDAANTRALTWKLISRYVSTKEFEAADELMNNRLKYRSRKFGPESMQVAAVKKDLAFVRMSLDKYQEAEKLLRQSVEAAERFQGFSIEIHKQGCRTLLASCLIAQEKYDDVQEVLEPVLKFKHWGQQHEWQHGNAQALLAEALIMLDQAEQAENLLHEAQSAFENKTSHQTPAWRKRNLRKMAERFVKLYSQLNEPEKLKEWQKRLAEHEETTVN